MESPDEAHIIETNEEKPNEPVSNGSSSFPELPKQDLQTQTQKAFSELQVHNEFGAFFMELVQKNAVDFEKVLTRLDECSSVVTTVC